MTQITENRRPILTTTSITQTLDHYSLQDSEPNIECEVTISVQWLRPQTLYEHFSHSINFAPSQLRQPFTAVQYWQEQEAALSIVQDSNKVLYLNTDYTSAQAGVWLPGKVSSVHTGASTQATVTIIPLNARNSTVCQETSIVLPLKVSVVTLLPRSASNNTCASINPIHASSPFKHCMYSDSESDTEEEFHAGITSLPSYADRHTSKNASTASLSALATGPPGTWEKHTKGEFICEVSACYCCSQMYQIV